MTAPGVFTRETGAQQNGAGPSAFPHPLAERISVEHTGHFAFVVWSLPAVWSADHGAPALPSPGQTVSSGRRGAPGPGGVSGRWPHGPACHIFARFIPRSDILQRESWCMPRFRTAQGSWSIGLFRGPSPLNLTPVESWSPSLNGSAAWPLANPIFTCAEVTDVPSNFGALRLPTAGWGVCGLGGVGRGGPSTAGPPGPHAL